MSFAAVMGQLRGMLDSMKKIREHIASGRRVSYHSDPAKGIEYNAINPSRHVSRRIYKVDIARAPNVVKGSPKGGFTRIDVLGEARLVNNQRPMIDYYVHKAKGRI